MCFANFRTSYIWAGFVQYTFSFIFYFHFQVTVFCIFWYQLYAGWSGAVQFDSIHLMFQHVLYTSLPPIINGILDRDLSAETLLQFPSIYRMGPEDQVSCNYVLICSSTNNYYIKQKQHIIMV